MTSEQSTAARVAELFDEAGVEYVFGYPGGRVIEVFEHLSSRMNQAGSVSVVRPRDEREASVMAEAYGRITGEPQVLAGQGPWIGSLGAIGQMEARLGSTPMVVLTEASERGDYSTIAPYQQSRGDYGGLDLPSILDGITKEHWFPRTPPETIRSVQLAFKHATAGRPGPCAVILDGDAIGESVPDDPMPPVWPTSQQIRNWNGRPTSENQHHAVEVLEGAERPVIIAGNGVHVADAYEELRTLATAYDAIVTTSYLGKSTIPETHDRAAGVIGSFGHEGANQVVSEADVLLAVGCRLNPMDTNWSAKTFIRPSEQTIIQIDVDSRNTGWVYPTDIGLIGDAAIAMSALAEAGEAESGWALERADRARNDFSSPACMATTTPIVPQRVVKEIERVIGEETVITADSGNNRFWLLNYLQTPAAGTYYGSGGVGGMGWAPPAAVAAALAGKEAICVAGDGGFGMTMTAVETAVQHDVGPTFVVMNDGSLGMVRQMGVDVGVEFPDTDFAGVAEALGGAGTTVEDPNDLRMALENAVSSQEPTVIDVTIDRREEMADQLQSSFYADVGGLHE